ncbi:MAG TPA: hypothetical protein VKV28_02160 [Candidatus Binataceae bacterium]|nr:hypothetical protein [Candidatus Binataceae bacterium]
MKVFGWIALIVGLLGCIWAGFVGSITAGEENSGANAIGIAIAALGGVYAGVKLIQESRSN